MKKHDVIVIGGSLAGAACVRELARLGIDGVALERDRFPRRKVCGGFLSPGAVDCLNRLGVLEEVRRAGAVDVRSAFVRIDRAEIRVPFRRPGLGVTRSVLDDVLARSARVQQEHAVQKVHRTNSGFEVDGVACSVVIDASGKLGRFTRRLPVDEFGVQYLEPQSRGDVLDFWFFKEAYGGAVSVEGGAANFCFLVQKSAAPAYCHGAGRLATGPLAYDKLPGDYIAIGDAAGMLDPFWGEGMHHALESGMLAAQVVANGIRRRAGYDEMKWEYESKWERRWAFKRALGAHVRPMRSYFGVALRAAPWLLNRIWD
jgi:flavin-dependent dehydrogenase